MTEVILGRQILCEYYDCDVEILNNQALLKEILIEAATKGNATVVTDVFHRFNPHGISGVVVIAESHLAIHTWPEYRCASVDIFSCSDKMNSELIVEIIGSRLKSRKLQTQTIKRGLIPRP